MKTSSSSYIKFIVLTIGHSGSKNLVKVLDEHAAIVMKGELLFNKRYKESLQLAIDEVNSIFGSQLPALAEAKGAQAIGFKLLYHQIWTHPVEFFAALKQSQPDVRIIHLVRSNYFEHYLSFYHNFVSRSSPDVLHVLNHISDTALRVTSMTQLAEAHPGASMTTLYEDCVQDFSVQLRRMTDFLQLPYQPLEFGSKRPLGLPWQRIHNWSVLCVAIRQRQQLDRNLQSDCLQRWSYAEWEGEHCPRIFM